MNLVIAVVNAALYHLNNYIGRMKLLGIGKQALRESGWYAWPDLSQLLRSENVTMITGRPPPASLLSHAGVPVQLTFEKIRLSHFTNLTVKVVLDPSGNGERKEAQRPVLCAVGLSAT